MLKWIQSWFMLSEAVINSKFGLGLISLLLLSLSCGRTDQIGNKLNADELAYLQTRATAKCISESDRAYQIITDAAYANLIDPDFRRDVKQWKYQKKEGSTTTDLGYLYVWNKSGNTLYMRLQETIDGDKYNTYYKLDIDQNDDMLRALQTKKCATTDSGVTESGSTVTVLVKDGNVTEPGTQYSQTDTTYKILPTLPAYFGKLYRTKVKRLYNSDGTLASTTTIEWTLTAVGADVQPSASYISTEYPNRKYGGPTYTVAAPYNTYSFPYTDNISTTVNQDTTAVSIWNGVNFQPNTEL